MKGTTITTFIVTSFFADRSRWFLWWPVGIGIGIAIYFSLLEEPPLIWVCLLFLGSLVGSRVVLKQWQEKPVYFFISLLILCLCLSTSLGFIASKMRTMWVATPVLATKIENVTVTGCLEDIEEQPHRRRLTLSKLTFSDPGMPPLSKVRLTVPLSQPLPATIGDRVSFVATLLPLGEPVSINGYNFRRQAYFQGIGATGYIKSTLQIVEQNERALWLNVYRHRLTQTIRDHLGNQEGEIAAALITGDRSGIQPTIRQAFTDAGLAHILAISGLHLTIVAGIIFLLFRRSLALVPYLVENFPIKKWAALWVILATFGYLAISGFGIPGQRAFIMITIVMIGILLDRDPLSMRLVAIAAIIILLVRPESLLSASFQLSFAAVIGLIAAYEDGWKALRRWSLEGGYLRRWIAYGIGVLSTTIVATLATTPYTMAIFNRFTLQTLAANFLAIPLISFVVMPAAIVSVSSLSWGGSGYPFQLLSFGLKQLILIAQTVSSWPGAAILVPTPGPAFVGLITLGGLWICLWKSSWRWSGVILCILGCFSFFFHHPATIYVSGERSVMAYRSEETLYISDLKRGQFYTEQWMKELGLKKSAQWSNSSVQIGPILLVNQRGISYKLSKEMCRAKTLVTTGYAHRSCQRWDVIPELLIDREVLLKKGTCQIWITKVGAKVTFVRDELGMRPWSMNLY